MVSHISFFETILYVDDQSKSTLFYEGIFRKQADLNVPGMTEFQIAENCKLGLMPNRGISKILAPHVPDPSSGTGISRCELYFFVKDLQLEFENAIRCGAQLVSPISDRDWGDRVCYFADPDGHIIAFAEKL